MFAQASVPEPLLAVMILAVFGILAGLTGFWLYLRVRDVELTDREEDEPE